MSGNASAFLRGAAMALIVSSAAAMPAQQPAAPSTSIPPATAPATLRIVVGEQVRVLPPDALQGMPRKTVTVTNAHTKATESYSGVPAADLLPTAPLGKALHGKALATYIVAEGADHYRAVLSLAEIDPAFHSGNVLVADTLDGKPIGEKDGPFRLIVTEDKRPARWVRNLVSLSVVTLP